MTTSIKEVKKALGLKDADIARFFGYKNNNSYLNSSRKKHIENGVIEIYKKSQEKT